MQEFESIKIYIENAQGLKDKVDRYCAIIEALEDAALKGAEIQDVEEYWLDDGQTKIKNIFRNPNEIFQAILNYQKLLQIALNKLNGRSFRMVDFNSNIIDPSC